MCTLRHEADAEVGFVAEVAQLLGGGVGFGFGFGLGFGFGPG